MHLRLKIDEHLKKVLPSACSSDNTITNPPKSNLNINFTVEKEMSDLSISSSSELLIKNESDINTLIFYLQEKFNMPQERLEKWKNNILFEMRDNQNYWKKERESMDEVAFLEYKRNFEAKMKVPTTPHKKELKTRSLAFIEYA